MTATPVAGFERVRQWKGQQPLSTPALSRAVTSRTPEPVSKSRPDAAADETLRIVLASLDDMKAEDSVTIDLTGKSSIGDYMVVATGTSQRHVASSRTTCRQGP